MSAGRSWIKEYYVGFLLLALSFLYLSHYLSALDAEHRRAALGDDLHRLQPHGVAASAEIPPENAGSPQG